MRTVPAAAPPHVRCIHHRGVSAEAIPQNYDRPPRCVDAFLGDVAQRAQYLRPTTFVETDSEMPSHHVLGEIDLQTVRLCNLTLSADGTWQAHQFTKIVETAI